MVQVSAKGDNLYSRTHPHVSYDDLALIIL